MDAQLQEKGVCERSNIKGKRGVTEKKRAPTHVGGGGVYEVAGVRQP